MNYHGAVYSAAGRDWITVRTEAKRIVLDIVADDMRIKIFFDEGMARELAHHVRAAAETLRASQPTAPIEVD